MLDAKTIRKRIPILKNRTKMQGFPLCFLDSASTSLKVDSMIQRNVDYYSNFTANMARSDYDLGAKVDKEVNITREKVARFINATKKDEIIFTANTTEALNFIAQGYAEKFLSNGDEIIVSVVEHAANLLPWYKAAKKVGAIVSFCPVDEQGNIELASLRKMVSSKTKIIALAHVSNVLAQLLDAKQAADIAHSVGAIFVLDAAQSVPHMPVDVQDLNCDFLVFSAHKMLGPTGVGILYGKYSLLEEADPVFCGGGMNLKYNMCGDMQYLHAPSKFEAGTLNLAGIISFAASIDYLNQIGMENVMHHDEELKQYALKKMRKVPNIIIYNDTSTTGVITFNIRDVFAQDVATYLNSKGICVRSGQHCSKILSERFETSSTVRVSTYLYTSKNDINRLCKALINAEDFLDAYFG